MKMNQSIGDVLQELLSICGSDMCVAEAMQKSKLGVIYDPDSYDEPSINFVLQPPILDLNGKVFHIEFNTCVGFIECRSGEDIDLDWGQVINVIKLPIIGAEPLTGRKKQQTFAPED